jgi:hypothetical protein
MDAIKTFSSATVGALRPRLQEALAGLASQLGVQIEVGSASFTHAYVKFQVIFSVIGPQGQVLTPEAEAFLQAAPIYGFSREDLGREVQVGGQLYRIAGLLPRSRRFPVLAERRPDGKMFKLPLESVRRALKAGAPSPQARGNADDQEGGA